MKIEYTLEHAKAYTLLKKTEALTLNDLLVTGSISVKLNINNNKEKDIKIKINLKTITEYHHKVIKNDSDHNVN